MPAKTDAALGFRAHTGWAAAVVVARPWDVVERRRIVYEPEATRFIYHRAAEMNCDEAETLIQTARAHSVERACAEIGALVSTLSERGLSIIAACVPGGNSRLPGSLTDILAAHARIHAAEGAFYRDVLADACTQLGLHVRRVPERDLSAIACASLVCSEEDLREWLAAQRKRLGAPWGEDQKLAALAAFATSKA
jgi:hypothetical protein